MNGAGGTSGGSGQFFLGLLMMCGGFYLLLNQIVVTSSFGFGTLLFGGAGFGLTSGMVLLPLMIGLVMVFYNAHNFWGWLVLIGSFAALIAGVIGSVHLNLRTMSAFDLLLVLVLALGGLGLFLRSLKDASPEKAS